MYFSLLYEDIFFQEKGRGKKPYSHFVWPGDRRKGRKIPIPLLKCYGFPLLGRKFSFWPAETDEQNSSSPFWEVKKFLLRCKSNFCSGDFLLKMGNRGQSQTKQICCYIFASCRVPPNSPQQYVSPGSLTNLSRKLSVTANGAGVNSTHQQIHMYNTKS